MVSAYADSLPEKVSVQEFVEMLKRGDLLERLKKPATTAGKEKHDL